MKRITFLPLFLLMSGLALAEPEQMEAGEEMLEIEMEDPGLEKMPELIHFAEADYPSHLQKRGIEGTVTLELLVNETGGVDSATVVEGFNPELDSSACRAALLFKFTPAVADGEQVAVRLVYEYRFTLKDVPVEITDFVNFEGKILERGTRNAVPDAVVAVRFLDTLSKRPLPLPFSIYLQKISELGNQKVEEGHLVTTTDSLGRFRFHSLPACSIEISIPVTGYEDFRTKELISENEVVDNVYYMRRLSYSDFEVVVYGRTEEKEVSRRQLTITEVKKIPGLGGDAIKVVQALPGVGRPAMGTGEVIVRGAPTYDSKFYLDGVYIPMIYHFGGLKSIYNSDALEAIDFYPGGFGTRYGGAIAGAIEITGRQPKTDRWHGFLDMNTLDGTAFVEGPINKKVSLLASGRRGFVGDILGLYFKNTDKELPVTVSPYYWDYLLRSDVTVDRNNKLFFTLFGSRDSLGVIVPRSKQGTKEINSATDKFGTSISFHMGLIGWDWEINEEWKSSMRASGTLGQQNMNMFGWVDLEQEYKMASLREELSFIPNKNIRLNMGVDVNSFYNDMILVMPVGSGAIARDTTNDWLFGVLGAYANAELKFGDNIQIIPGIRYDYFPELDYKGGVVPELWNYSFINNNRGLSGEPSFRLTGRWTLQNDHTLKGAVGNYSQSPQPMGQVIHPTWGEPTLPATKAAHYVAGHEWQITDLISSDVQLYLNRQWDIPRMAGSGDMSEDQGSQKLWSPDAKGRMYGLELMLRHNQSERFFGWIAYTLSRSERYDEPSRKYLVYDQDETHHVQLLASWHLDKDWDLGFRARYVTGKPITPILGAKYLENENMFVPLYGEENSSRHDPFFQLDLRADKKIAFKNWIFSTYIDLQNVSYFLYKSPEFEYYNYDYSDKTVVGMIPMLAFGFKAEF